MNSISRLPHDDGISDESAVVLVSSSGTTGPSKSVIISGAFCQSIKYTW